MALQVAAAAPAQASVRPAGAPANSSEAAEARGHALANENRWAEAAEALAEALREVPNDAARRGRRNQLASEAINAYGFAFEAAPGDCRPLTAGLVLADEFLAALRVQYGVEAATAEDHVGVARLRGELEQVRVAHKCPEPPKRAPPYLQEPDPRVPRVDMLESQPRSPGVDLLEPASERGTPPTQGEPPRRSRMPLFVAGAGVSAGLMIGMAIGAGVLYSRLRGPYGDRGSPDPESYGELWHEVYKVAEKNDVPHGAEAKNICENNSGNVTALNTACENYERARNGFYAMAALGGVFAVTTVLFSVLAVRERRKQSAAGLAWRRHQVQVGAAPRAGGAQVFAGFRF